MRFTKGLKKLFSVPLYTIIVLLFVVSYIFFIIGLYFLGSPGLIAFIYFFITILIGFVVLIMIFSIFIPVEKMGKILITISVLIAIPFFVFYQNFLEIFYAFAIFANQFLTALFAFKIGMDASQRFDDSLYSKKKSRKVTRVLEFLIFGTINVILFWFARQYLFPINPIIGDTFLILLIVHLVLIGFVLIRLLFTKKLSAYITLFFILSFIYVLYIVIDTLSDVFFPSGGFQWISFLIDLFLFFWILGAIFYRVDYIKEKIKILRADTIALFAMVMKLNIGLIKLEIIPVDPGFLLWLSWWLFAIFIGFTVLFGIYNIFAHKEGKKKERF
jgi:hypothetical protein